MQTKTGDQFVEIVHGIDVLHCVKEGNNIRIRATARVKPDFLIENEVTQIRRLYHNYLFQKTLMENHLKKAYAFTGFQEIFRTYPHEYFFKYADGHFKNDAITYFEEQKKAGGTAMSEENQEARRPRQSSYLCIKLFEPMF